MPEPGKQDLEQGLPQKGTLIVVPPGGKRAMAPGKSEAEKEGPSASVGALGGQDKDDLFPLIGEGEEGSCKEKKKGESQLFSFIEGDTCTPQRGDLSH